MALSCGLPFQERIDGSVGWPLPGVEVRLVDVETGAVIDEDRERQDKQNEVHSSKQEKEEEAKEGEIQLRGPTVFTSYWRNSSATLSEFTSDINDGGGGKWFKTGDIAARRLVPGLENKGPAYFILGRKSTDIIKTGGEKVSALEVERELLALYALLPLLCPSPPPFSLSLLTYSSPTSHATFFHNVLLTTPPALKSTKQPSSASPASDGGRKFAP